MFNKVLASFGIGAAKVDTVLATETLYPGQDFHAEIHIQGGEVDQVIDNIDLALMTKAKTECNDSTQWVNFCLASWQIPVNQTIAANQRVSVPFQAQLNPETPITFIEQGYNQSVVWLQTGLDIDFAVDPTDTDAITVLPTPIIEHFLHAMNQLGYRLVKTDVEKGFINAPGFRSQSGCYQEFEFKPNSRRFFGIKEVELSFVCEPNQTHVLIELDRAFSGDGYQSVSMDNQSSLSTVQSYLQRLLG